jgi:hypothetical protein
MIASTPPAGPVGQRVYIDSLSERTAKLLVQDAQGTWLDFVLPRSLLPASAQENQWLLVRIEGTAAPDEAQQTATLRKKLSAQDDGGDFSL